MNSEKLSTRLHQVATYLIEYANEPLRLADIGSDHAYLPCYLGLNNHLEFAVAGEVVEGPFQSATNEVAARQLTDIIAVRKGDGLAVVTPEDHLNAISICGMGGSLIRDILAKGEDLLTPEMLVVLQPNMASFQLRQWLNLNQFEFLTETVVTDHQRQYEIIVARKVAEPVESLSLKALQFGPFNLQHPTTAFYEKWQGELAVLQQVRQQLEQTVDATHTKAQAVREQIELIEAVLNEAPTDMTTT
ncbi:tRNA (adenine(22)-N(1))-methyltransferase TrmK [Aerococcaceae bacterium zg-BR22]|uniref:tRNA (adenine(22)-N(1))-methyltransferase n=1 Tax=Aerococcaceae bacterium zg-1292 TaxID=2774330 RepID=UPI0040644790|nr:tRNA (adenine(22)-N(1))-methyltransferase TrmK [Aerococcaceae bacterium zg-BR22]